MYSSTPENLRPGFTDDDDNEMWRFLLKKLNEPDYGPARLPNGLVLWRDFIKEEPSSRLAQKTESNLASHFRKSMRGRIMDSNLTNDEIRFIFRSLHWNMGSKEETILKERISPVPLKPRLVINLKSPRKRSILVSTVEASGFIDSEVEQETPRKKKRQLQYGKLDDDVFMRPGTRNDDGESVDFLFADSNQSKKQKSGEKANNSREGNNKENDGHSSDTSSYDSLEHLGSKTPSARRHFRPNVDVSETSHTSEDRTPVRRRSRRIQSRKISEDIDINKILADVNVIVETVSLQNDDVIEVQQDQETIETRKKKESTEKLIDMNENGTLNQQSKEISIEESSGEEADAERIDINKERVRLNEKRKRIHEEISRITAEINKLHKEKNTVNTEKGKTNGALERRPPTVDLSSPVIETNVDVNLEEAATEENGLNQEARVLTPVDNLDVEVPVVERPIDSASETTEHHPDTEIPAAEPNANTENPPEPENYELAPVTLSCMRVAFHYANGDDVELDDDTLAAAKRLEISKSLDQYLRNLVQHFKNDNYTNEKNPHGTEPASSVESLPYYT